MLWMYLITNNAFSSDDFDKQHSAIFDWLFQRIRGKDEIIMNKKIHSLHKLDYFTPLKKDAIILDVSISSNFTDIVKKY